MNILKKYWLTIAIIILLLVCGIMLMLYFRNMSENFSSNPSDWGAFGGYLGSITGLLAFSGVLYTVVQSNKSHKENSERDMFFKLLELHNNKVKSIEINDKIGVDAFRLIAELIENNLNYLLLCRYVRMNFMNKKEKELSDLCEKHMDLICWLSHINDSCFCYMQDDYGRPSNSFSLDYSKAVMDELLRKMNSNLIIKNKIDRLNPQRLEQWLRSVTIDRNIINPICDYLDSEYGRILDHYFSNIYCLLNEMSSFSNNSNYIGIFRSQLSRYELVVILFHALKYDPSDEQILLLKRFDVLRFFNPKDVLSIFVLLEREKQEKPLQTEQKNLRVIINKMLDRRPLH